MCAPWRYPPEHRTCRHSIDLTGRQCVGGNKGATTSHVIIDVAGTKIFASITNKAVADLGLKFGK